MTKFFSLNSSYNVSYKGKTKEKLTLKNEDFSNEEFESLLRDFKDKNNLLYVRDMVRIQQRLQGVQSGIKNPASQDGVSVWIGIEQDPGQAGVSEADDLVRTSWNEDFFRELKNFPEGAENDIVDALSGAFLLLNEKTLPSFICLISALCYCGLTDEIMREFWIAIAHATPSPTRAKAYIVRMRNISFG